MPSFFRAIGDEFKQRLTTKQAERRYDGFTGDGRVVLTDFRGRREARPPEADTKSNTLGDDPLAIYKPTGAKTVDAANAMANFTCWTYAAVNAIASEIANIQWRLYQIKGEDHEEQPDHPLLELLVDAFEHPRHLNCPAIDGIIAEAEDVTGEADEQAVDAAITAPAQALEHYEITRYGALIAWAKRLARDDCATILEQNLQEEQAADQRLGELADRDTDLRVA
jgi:ferritin-like metal-binding protein YciE